MQYPIGRMSDWFDRRLVILIVAIFAGCCDCIYCWAVKTTDSNGLQLFLEAFQ